MREIEERREKVLTDKKNTLSVGDGGGVAAPVSYI